MVFGFGLFEELDHVLEFFGLFVSEVVFFAFVFGEVVEFVSEGVVALEEFPIVFDDGGGGVVAGLGGAPEWGVEEEGWALGFLALEGGKVADAVDVDIFWDFESEHADDGGVVVGAVGLVV